MRLCLSLALPLAFTFPAVGAEPKDPLRYFPPQIDVVLKVEKPRALVEAVFKHDLAKEAQQLQFVRDFLDSANYRRFFQLLAHFEKQFGAPWPELIDKLAGGGMALGFKYAAGGNNPTLIAVQGTDEKTVARFFDLGLSLLEEELTRQGAKEMLKRKTYQGVECVQLDEDAVVARAGDVLFFANKGEALKAGLDQWAALRKEPNTPTIADTATKQAGGILPPNPAAWLWVNLKPVKELPEAKNVFATPRNDVVQTVLFAAILDVARRSDFVAAGLYADKGDFRITIRMPAGRTGMAPDVELHLPKDPKVGGTLPLLEPKGVLFSYSFYFDFGTFYQKREQIFPPQVAKDLGEGEKQVSRLLIGSNLPKFLSQLGVHYRVVVAQPETVAEYKTQPEQKLPAFAVVLSMRDPAVARLIKALIKGGVLAVGQTVALKPWDAEIAGVQAFGYSFPEQGKFPDDPQNLRFNYQPTFGAHKDQYILASNRGLLRELVGLLDREDRSKPANANAKARVYAAGVGGYANILPGQTLAATILGQAVKVGEARQQTEALFKLLEKLGTAGFEMDITDDRFRADLYLKTSK